MKPKLKIVRSLTAAFITFGPLVGGADAALVLYTSRSAWETAVSNLSLSVTTEGFESVDSDIVLEADNITAQVGQLMLEYGPYGVQGSPANATVSASTNDVTVSANPANSLSFIATDPFSLPINVDAFGFDYSLSAAPGEWVAVINAPGDSAFLGDGDANSALGPPGGSGFVGWVDDELAGSIGNLSVVNALTAGATVTIDNVSFAAVPEPSSAILISIGCLGFAFRRSRK